MPNKLRANQVVTATQNLAYGFQNAQSLRVEMAEIKRGTRGIVTKASTFEVAVRFEGHSQDWHVATQDANAALSRVLNNQLPR